MDDDWFVVVGPRSRPSGPRSRCTLEARSAEAYTSGMDYKSILTIWFSIEISRNEWDIEFWGLFWLLQKNGGKIWIFKDRRKGFSERGKKVHFWKIHFQNLLQKSKIRNFAAIFVYIEYMNEFWFCRKWYQQMEGQKNFFTLGPFGSSLHILQIKLLVYWFVVGFVVE